MVNEAQPVSGAGERRGLGRRGRQALAAAAAGLYVFPLYPGTKDRPAVTDWENEATRDREKITRWWTERPYNIAIATRPSRLVVVDLDPRKPGQEAPAVPYERCQHGLQVFQMLAAAAEAAFPLDTYRVVSPSGGQHLYFRAPDDVELRNSQRRLAPLIDVRAGGGYIVAATSSRREGGRYRAVNSRPIAPLPQWLREVLLAARQEPMVPPAPAARPVSGPVAAAHSARVRAYVERIVDNVLEELATVPAGVGKRHEARRNAALKLGSLVGGGHLCAEDARARLLDVALTHVGVTTDPSGRVHSRTTAREVVTTIENGLDYGMKRPRVVTEMELQARPRRRR